MLHLYERNAEPPPFPKPHGFIRTTICATTGHAPPSKRCPGIVQEWILPRDLRAIGRLDPEPSLHIVFPHEGDVFVRDATAGALASQEQEVALRADDERRRVHWNVGGAAIGVDANGTAFWPLQLGTWRITASDGLHRQTITIHVVPPPHRFRPGFTFGSSSQ
ncbi:MAG: hypothetical protein JO113_02180 [Candidatus Eremiobacteraeota bacterium]|nr:hypothetical protein [Candidatus Eremiobacteraeota bacterium]